MTEYRTTAAEILARIRRARPVVHSITNYVVMNSTANVLLAMGASPIMAHAPEEIEEIVTIASSVVINIGTLSQPWIQSMKAAAQAAKKSRKPFLLDPVGAGATHLRTHTALDIIASAIPTVVRGNASEILSLSSRGGTTRGVDAIHDSEEALDPAREIALSMGTVIAVTGERDIVTDGRSSLVVSGGHALMSYVTGTGCAASVIIGAFLAEEMDPLVATACALAFFGVAGKKAAVEAPVPGSFWVKVLDALYTITPEELAATARISRI